MGRPYALEQAVCTRHTCIVRNVSVGLMDEDVEAMKEEYVANWEGGCSCATVEVLQRNSAIQTFCA